MGLARVRNLIVLAVTAAVLATVVTVASPAAGALPVDDYAPYQPQTRCAPKAKPGTVVLGRWVERRFGGNLGGISRPCRVGGRSEHKEGRAFDWTVNARRPADRRRVHRFLTTLFATDAAGNPDALARRMGVMYVIWDDRIWSAWNGFRAEPYRHSGCKRLRRCSPTLRHRDHVHVSITRQAARGLNSWYVGRV
ncbi:MULTISPECIES: hypothetical protein [Nocardioides]|uniref:ARB-07466-like C-terminal domain-containing protein n=1 Tax=Nocardioides vastitatis TaxID=2568655 RepID=A0ABW0ZLW4_9ACTN|nr:hypothetical protein [Nocardioides sp.]THI98454.1 hypothetical protein E7Z54_13640 [Nocardioides sp.]